ncbi:MAG TPA: ABC transporter permease [Pseudonocardiaceae bacterium]|nr:ABC transporter permease [Pseudonocardiaceae bacterium]
MTSAFPRPIEELIPQAQRLARELGTWPSQNKVKATLHIRAERAKAVLQALKDSGFDPTAPEPPVRLHVVPEQSDIDPQEASEQVNDDAGPVVPTTDQVRRWPVILLAAPAFVAIWSGWVGVGVLTGFGPVHPLPGIASGFTINSAITLPIGVETYAAYALRVWLSGAGPVRAQRFAKRSAIAAFVLGGLGQIAYHLMTAAHLTVAPWPITTAVSCLPVVVLGFGAALAHLQGRTEDGR